MNIVKNNIARLLAIFALAAVFSSAAHAADRYVVYSLAEFTFTAWGVCDDSTTIGYHTPSSSEAESIETYTDGVNNGLDGLQIEIDESVDVGTYLVGTLNGSGENVYLVVTD